MSATIQRISRQDALARQREILKALRVSAHDLLERVERYDFDFDDQVLAEEYSRLQFLLTGSR
ncbi:hypothetical protein [Pseudactinotalea sp. HY158]|uniref:hypothetical protein n=1 Tax=Pseudactinotalea sp. HY158 TaxID=2654547 RepID=UPI00129C895A|nr:hypothetical protein [Pseudactinotalea sp. HY158]QGH68170.1 hypothetical protein GCE65_00515 [Pseudactinotalea sp. HY158]